MIAQRADAHHSSHSPFPMILDIGTGDLDLLPPMDKVLQQDEGLGIEVSLSSVI